MTDSTQLTRIADALERIVVLMERARDREATPAVMGESIPFPTCPEAHDLVRTAGGGALPVGIPVMLCATNGCACPCVKCTMARSGMFKR